jgi:hypothetical protein
MRSNLHRRHTCRSDGETLGDGHPARRAQRARYVRWCWTCRCPRPSIHGRRRAVLQPGAAHRGTSMRKRSLGEAPPATSSRRSGLSGWLSRADSSTCASIGNPRRNIFHYGLRPNANSAKGQFRWHAGCCDIVSCEHAIFACAKLVLCARSSDFS